MFGWFMNRLGLVFEEHQSLGYVVSLLLANQDRF
jgi:hypothetical protein